MNLPLSRRRSSAAGVSLSRGTAAVAALGLVLSALAGCQTVSAPASSAATVGELVPGSGFLRGYLDPKALPDSLSLLPKPPAEGSATLAADQAIFQSTRALRDSPRWQLAAADANLTFPKAADTFSCALDLPITQERTPHLVMLLRRSLTDAGVATRAAKNAYHRKRPFATTGEASCTPTEEARLGKNGAYPSGHAAAGWAWALLLAEIAPDRANAVLGRGFEFGQSRVICGVHWQSDVDTGRVIGAATVAVLHSDATFRAQLAAASAEVADDRAKGRHSGLDCAREASALAH
jgi:acid phosphatase (class A)